MNDQQKRVLLIGFFTSIVIAVYGLTKSFASGSYGETRLDPPLVFILESLLLGGTYFFYKLYGEKPDIKRSVLFAILLTLTPFFIFILMFIIGTNIAKLNSLNPSTTNIPTTNSPKSLRTFLIIPANNNGSWHQAISFSGSNPKTSDQFTIKGDQWKVSYKVSGGYYNLGGVKIKIESGDGRIIGNDLIFANSNADQYKLENGPGTFYITTNPDDNVSYTITVEDYY